MNVIDSKKSDTTLEVGLVHQEVQIDVEVEETHQKGDHQDEENILIVLQVLTHRNHLKVHQAVDLHLHLILLQVLLILKTSLKPRNQKIKKSVQSRKRLKK